MTGLITDPYDPDVTPESFDFDSWLASQDAELLSFPAGRRTLTRLDPFLFAVIYLDHHLVSEDTGDVITYAQAHFDWYRLMRQWVQRTWQPRGWRHSFAAPRSCAKSTVWFTIAPIWGGAHGHVRFVAAFADSGTQSEMHLQTFRTELAHNPLLRMDYPEFCTAQRKPTGRTVADNEGMFQSRNGFVFAARGADTASLGMKVSNQRPDAIVLDDIEKHESQYSLDAVTKRRSTILNAIFPLNERARVVIVGTTTRPGSIVHQLVQVADGEQTPTGDEYGWIADEKITPHHYEPVLVDDDGTRRSCWPAKWPLTYLDSIAGTRSYQLNMRCNPAASDGDYWMAADHLHGIPGTIGRVYCWIDPPTTEKQTSDYAGIVIAGYLPGGAPRLPELLAANQVDPDRIKVLLTRAHGPKNGAPQPGVVILHASQTRKTGRTLMRHVAGVIARTEALYGKRVRGVLCEANQGGDLWHESAEHLAIPFRTFTVPSNRSKAWRIEKSLDYYQSMRVFHAVPVPDLERQQITYPALAHDDVIDAASSAILAFLDPRKRHRSSTQFPR
jgi:hypothetical protein